VTETDVPLRDDPYELLGLKPGAGETEIRAAYVAAIKEHPAESEPELYEKLRKAFAILRDPVERACFELTAVTPTRPLDDLLGDSVEERRFAGPDAWQAVLKGVRR